jgi:hypothetical protein
MLPPAVRCANQEVRVRGKRQKTKTVSERQRQQARAKNCSGVLPFRTGHPLAPRSRSSVFHCSGFLSLFALTLALALRHTHIPIDWADCIDFAPYQSPSQFPITAPVSLVITTGTIASRSPARRSPRSLAIFRLLPVSVSFPNLRSDVISIASTPGPTAVVSGDTDGRDGGGRGADFPEQ